MPFINERVLEVDSTKYNLDQLYKKHNDKNFTYSYNWIRDKETETWLMPIKNLNNNETIWILHYKNTNIEIKLYKTRDSWDLISIAPNSLKNQEIIETLQNALKAIESSDAIWARPKKVASKEKKEIKKEVKKTPQKRISYLDVLVGVIVLIVLFYIANDRNKILPTVVTNDNNKTTTKKQTIKPEYNICATRSDGVFFTNSKDLNSNLKIIDSKYDQCNIDKYGNIYLISNTDEALYKANSDGTNIRKILSLPLIPSGLAIDNEGQRIFSAQWSKKIKAHEIVYSDLSGNNKNILISNRKILRSVSGMFYDYVHDNLYFADGTGQQIGVIDLKTKEVRRVVFSSHPVGVVLDYKNNKIVWLDRVDKNLYSANFDGSNKKILIDYNAAENSVLHGVDYALTIDTKNNRLVFGYPSKKLKKEDFSMFNIETSNLDGTKRVKVISKNTTFKSFSFFDNTYIASKKAETTQQTVVETQNILAITPKIKHCLACHGQDWSKSALGKSAIVKNISKENIARALKGYKNGTYGGEMKGLMKGQVAKYSNQELEAIAQAIKSQ